MRGGRAAAARAEETRVMRDAVQDGMAAAREAISVGVDVSDFFFLCVCFFFLIFVVLFSTFFVLFCLCVWVGGFVFSVCAHACARARA